MHYYVRMLLLCDNAVKVMSLFNRIFAQFKITIYSRAQNNVSYYAGHSDWSFPIVTGRRRFFYLSNFTSII